MSAVLHRVAPPLSHDTTQCSKRAPLSETLLLRFLVQHGIIPASLLKLIDIERAGAGTSMSLLDWLVQRSHVSEEALTAALGACLHLQPADLAPFALDQAPPLSCATHADRNSIGSKPRHLRLVSSRPHAPRSSTSDRRAPRPRVVRQTA